MNETIITRLEISADMRDELKHIAIDNRMTLKKLTTSILTAFIQEYKEKPAIMIAKIQYGFK